MTPETPTVEASDTNVLLRWTAKPYHVHERTSAWYVRAGIAACALAVFAILTSSWTFVVVIILAVGVYFLLRDHHPEEQTVEIREDGVSYRGIHKSWNDFRGYFLKVTPANAELHLIPAIRRQNSVVLQADNVDLKDLRDTLNARLTMLTDAEESLLDSFIRFCKL